MSVPIFEPELNYLQYACECGTRFVTDADLDLHKRSACLRKFDPDFRQPPVPRGMLPGSGGVADGGRRT
jgi:hypothetical protein